MGCCLAPQDSAACAASAPATVARARAPADMAAASRNNNSLFGVAAPNTSSSVTVVLADLANTAGGGGGRRHRLASIDPGYDSSTLMPTVTIPRYRSPASDPSLQLLATGAVTLVPEHVLGDGRVAAVATAPTAATTTSHGDGTATCSPNTSAGKLAAQQRFSASFGDSSEGSTNASADSLGGGGGGEWDLIGVVPLGSPGLVYEAPDPEESAAPLMLPLFAGCTSRM